MFNTKMIVEKIKRGLFKKWVLRNAITFTSDIMGKVYRPPVGFVSNLTSSPFFFWWIVPPDGTHAQASLLHDYLYSSSVDIPRLYADRVYKEALRCGDTPLWLVHTLYGFVRVFGWIFFRKFKE